MLRKSCLFGRLLCCVSCFLFTSFAASALAEDLPVDGQEVIVGLDWLGLNVGHIWGDHEHQLGLTLRTDWDSLGVSVEGSFGRRFYRGPTYRLRAVTGLSVTGYGAFPADLGAGLSISLINEWRAGKVILFTGPRLDFASTLVVARARREQLLAIGGVGVDVLGARIWTGFQAGYTFNSRGGSLFTQATVSIEFDRTCTCKPQW